VLVPAENIEYIDVAPSQMVGVSAGLIPFLEHDDANRASWAPTCSGRPCRCWSRNRRSSPPAWKRDVAVNSGLIVRAARRARSPTSMPSRIEITASSEPCHRRVQASQVRRSERSGPAKIRSPSWSARPEGREGRSASPTAAATYKGELALGRNVLVGFMAWDGFNFEDAIIISEELVEDDVYTSIHIEEYDIEIRDTKLGREEFTRDIPNVGERALHEPRRERASCGSARMCRPATSSWARRRPRARRNCTPEEKLLHAIFGRGRRRREERLARGAVGR